ncbi:MAG: hypothetical protein KC910_27195 [Candidatus Eremiobacteraeota bacterium]|nr:hypothetical protein [Candidatus Eremiobacteraeota bacterium]
MTDSNDRSSKPVTSFSNCVDLDVVVYVADADQLAPLGLPIDKGQLGARLVGVDRKGIWIEPTKWLEKGLDSGDEIGHVFLKWDNVLSVVRKVESDLFAERKEYRGLRPR